MIELEVNFETHVRPLSKHSELVVELEVNIAARVTPLSKHSELMVELEVNIAAHVRPLTKHRATYFSYSFASSSTCSSFCVILVHSIISLQTHTLIY